MHRNVKIGLRTAGIVATGLLLMANEGCDESDAPPGVDSDSSSSYDADARIPVDDEVYLIRGEVVGQANSLTRQVEPAQGSATIINGTGSASYFGPVETGRGFVRVRVQSSKPAVPEAREGEVSILKVSDTKGTALLPGDIVTFKCRRQYEAIAAVRNNSSFDQGKVETWELDYCRLADAVIEVRE